MEAEHKTGGPAAALRDLGVLVTRPTHQAAHLCALIEGIGGRAVCFPALEIAPLQDTRTAQRRIARLAEYHIAIFISANAVEFALPLLQPHLPWPEHVRIAAVGRATAEALARGGLHVDVQPQDRFDSEALLALEAMQRVQGRPIIIFRGLGGRDLLANILRARGARVDYAELYRRGVPDTDPTTLLRGWRAGGIDVVTATSDAVLQNLFEMLGAPGRGLLLATPVVVLSERTAALAAKLGFERPAVVAPQASDEGIVQALVDMALQTNPQAGAVVGMGFLQKNGDVYEVSAEYKKALLTINGQPMPIPLGSF